MSGELLKIRGQFNLTWNSFFTFVLALSSSFYMMKHATPLERDWVSLLYPQCLHLEGKDSSDPADSNHAAIVSCAFSYQRFLLAFFSAASKFMRSM